MHATRHLIATAVTALLGSAAALSTAAPTVGATAGPTVGQASARSSAVAPALAPAVASALFAAEDVRLSVDAVRQRLPARMKPQAGGVLRLYQQLRGQPIVPGADSEPDTERADTTLAPLALPDVLATLDTALATAPTALIGTLQTARQAYASALDQLHAGSTGGTAGFLATALAAMASGQAAMDQALDIASSIDPGQVALLLPAVQKVRDAAARMARDQVDLALAAGVSSARLSPAQDALRVADALHQAGDYGGGASQYANAFNLAANTLVFSIDRFEQNLRASLDGQSVGYSYAISQAGQLVRHDGEGQARTGADLPATTQSSGRRMHVASVSKTLTAIVVLRLLKERGLSVDSAIGAYLPSGWSRGTGVNAITFRELLTHRSGFGQNLPPGSDYLSLRAMVGQAVPNRGSWDYENANFGLMRVLVGQMLGGDAPAFIADPGAWSTAFFLQYASSAYATVGVPYSCEPSSQAPTLQYDFPDTGNPGYVEPSRSLQCGGYGVHISARNLARTLAYLRYTADLLPATEYQQMKTGYLGFMNPDRYNFAQGKFGIYHTHGGDWDHSGGSRGEGGLDACIMVFPINVEASLLINSSRKNLGVGYPNGGYQCSVLKWAFENAWVPQ